MREYIIEIEDTESDESEIFIGYIRRHSEEIIRCRDCKYYGQVSRSCNMHDCPGDILDPDDFCSWSEPKGEKI